jgi:hypothetical protein
MLDNLAGVPNPLMLTKLAYFVDEREHVRREREAGAPRPWTEDMILDQYRFCNVRRRDDRVSAWIINHIIEPYKDNSHLWFMLCCARWINWPPTLQGLMDEGLWPVDYFDAEAFGDYIDRRVESGVKSWTGAYLITARQLPAGMGKGRWVAKTMLEPLTQKHVWLEDFFLQDGVTVEKAIEAFKGAYGFGTFMTGQVVADLTYSPVLCDAPDLYSYAPIGPGSTRGLNRLFGRGLDKRIIQDQFNDELQYVAQKVSSYVYLAKPKLTLHDWQNCMCEFDKYIRTDNGSGRPRSTYKPETAF